MLYIFIMLVIFCVCLVLYLNFGETKYAAATRAENARREMLSRMIGDKTPNL
jgi:hypothetical protein